MRGIIYYFSGTGNSMSVAKQVAQKFDGMEVVKITADLCDQAPVVDVDILGIVYPIYAFGPPLIVSNFLQKFTVKRADYLFAIAASGDAPGNAMKRFEALCIDKGLSLDSAFVIEMPGNYIIEEDPPTAEKAKRLVEEAAVTLGDIIARIGRREKVPVPIIPDPPDPYFVEAKELMLDSASRYREVADQVGQAAIGETQNRYDIFTLMCNQLDRQFQVLDECTSCGICEMVCPVDNIKMDEMDLPEWTHNCEMCLACLSWCPEDVIHFGGQTLGRTPYRHAEFSVHDLIAENARQDA